MKPEKILKQISEILIKQGVSIADPGLLHGKMGIIIFFFHYARYMGDATFEDHAMVLMDEIQEQVLKQPGMDYANGLAGIGSGIEYLSQNNFIEANTNEILEDFDERLFDETSLGNHTNAGLHTGLTGLGRYFLLRIAGRDANDEHVGTLNNKMQLIRITDILDRMFFSLKEEETEDVFRFLCDMNKTNLYPAKTLKLLNHFSQNNMLRSRQMKIEELFHEYYENFELDIDMVPDLYGGLAGAGLYLLGNLDKQHKKWINLL
ncbi:MAG: hypothetical protein FWD60_09555 [Candidatus Azobacteroides sp.]|nr:hypothetical protein [Candidatus Azobacteroides sp.]